MAGLNLNDPWSVKMWVVDRRRENMDDLERAAHRLYHSARLDENMVLVPMDRMEDLYRVLAERGVEWA